MSKFVTFYPTPENEALLKEASKLTGKSIEEIINEVLTVNRLESAIEQFEAKKEAQRE